MNLPATDKSRYFVQPSPIIVYSTCFHSLVKTEANVWENLRADHLLENSHKHCRGFHQVMKARRTCFFIFYKIIIFCLNKEKDVIGSPYVYFLNFFNETVNSHKLETANHIAYVIFLLRSAIKLHL